jgi:hypothetical protein
VIPIGLLFAICAIHNWLLLIFWSVGKIRGRDFSTTLSGSFVLPFVGPLFGVLLAVLVPVTGVRSFWWVAFLLEPTWLFGCVAIVTAPFVDRSA